MNKQQTLIRFVVTIMLIMTTSSCATSRTHEQKCSCIRAYNGQEKVPYLKIGDGTFVSPHLNKELPYTIYGPDITPQQAGKFVDHLFGCAVILKNLPIERLGQASDAEVIQDLIQKNLLVVEVDYNNDKNASGQGMYKDFLALWYIFGGAHHPGQSKHVPRNYAAISRPVPSPVDEIRLKSDKKNGEERVYKIDPKPWTYVMPEGFTVTRNLYIDTIITKFNVEMPLRMDVIHPFNSKCPVPALLEVSGGFMIPNGRRGRQSYNSPFPFTWTMYGYGAAIMDNVPNIRGSQRHPYYGEVPAVPYGPYFPEKRALRILRAHKEELQLTGKVIICGVSKSARRAAASAFINEYVSGQPSRWMDYPCIKKKPAEKVSIKYVQEKLGGKLIGEKDKGPHADQSDRFDGAYLIPTGSMGTKSEEKIGFVDASDPPAYITQQDYNGREEEGIEKAVQQCKEAGLRFKASDPICHPGLDHNFNMYKLDEMVEYFNSVIGNEEEK